MPPLNGEYVGQEQVLGGFLAKLMELSGGTFRVEVHDLAGTDRHAMAIVHETAERDGRTLDAYNTHVFQVEDGKVARLWGLFGPERGQGCGMRSCRVRVPLAARSIRSR